MKDDAANANMGGDWHMPTDNQISELINNTTSTWATQDNVNGTLFTSKKNTSKSIFIPAVGTAKNGSVHSNGDYGAVWSSMMGTYDVGGGKFLFFNLEGAKLYSDGTIRNSGLSIRGVIG